MTINEVLARVKADRPGESTDAEMIQWLSQLDGRWADEVVRTHWLPEPVYQEMLVIPKPQGEKSKAGVTATVEGRTVTVNGTGSWSGRWTLWTFSVTLYEGREYTAIYDGSGEADPSDVNYLYIRDPDGTTVDYVQANEGAVFTPEKTGKYSFSLTLTGGTYENYRMAFTLKGYVSPADFEGYETSVDRATELLIPAPDDEVYIHWLYAKIDYRLGELERYNADSLMFNASWDAAAKRYNRHNRPLGHIVNHVAYGRPVPWWGDEDPLNQRTGGMMG